MNSNQVKTAEKIAAVLVVFVFLAPTVLAPFEFLYSRVFFTVASTAKFRVSMPGGLTNVSNDSTAGPPYNTTADIWFNATSNTQVMVVPCSVGGGNCQSGNDNGGTPILMFTNLGTNLLDLTIAFNESIPSGIAVVANVSNNATDSPTLTGVNMTVLAFGTPFFFSNQTGLNNQTLLFLWANFTGVAAGQYESSFNYTSNTSGGT